MNTRIGVAALLVLAVLSCQGTPTRPVPERPEPQTPLEDFSAQNVWNQLQALTEIGPRASGTDGAARARAYIRDQLDAFGLEVEEQPFTVGFDDGSPALQMENLVATVPGASDDLFVLAAPYDTRYFESFRFVGANAGGSGAALLLELARVIAHYPLPYTTRIAFLDAEAPLGRGDERERQTAWIGSTTLARSWQAAGVTPHIRLLVYVDRVCDADLKLARDLFSHRPYREIFWSSAAQLGYTDAFEPGRPYESPRAGHQAFLDAGVRRVIALVDPSFGGDEPPGLYANSEDDTMERCSPSSFEVVGRVTLASLETIGQRLAKIDRFSDAPLSDLPAETGAPSEPAPEPAPEEAGAGAEQPAGTAPQEPAAGAQAEPSVGPQASSDESAGGDAAR